MHRGRYRFPSETVTPGVAGAVVYSEYVPTDVAAAAPEPHPSGANAKSSSGTIVKLQPMEVSNGMVGTWKTVI